MNPSPRALPPGPGGLHAVWAQHLALSRPGLCQGGAGTGAIQAAFTLQSPQPDAVPQAGTALRDMASCRLPPGSTCFSKENRFWGKERPPTLAFAHTQPRPSRKLATAGPGQGCLQPPSPCGFGPFPSKTT